MKAGATNGVMLTTRHSVSVFLRYGFRLKLSEMLVISKLYAVVH